MARCTRSVKNPTVVKAATAIVIAPAISAISPERQSRASAFSA
jgi:hypothetical protein